MKKLLFVLLLGYSSLVSAYPEPNTKTELENKSNPVVLLENESISVTGESYEFNGENYLKVVITNKLNESIRCLYSITLNGERQLLSYDGTVEAIITINANETTSFGDSKDNNPIIKIGDDWKHATKVQLTILH